MAERSSVALRRALADPLLATSHPIYKPLLWVLLGTVLVFFGWAWLAQLDEVTRGDGRVVPFSRMQKIQSLEGGILDRLLVQEGELVEPGQPLVRLDATHFRTNFEESANQSLVLRASIARLDAEVLGKTAIVFPEDVAADAALVRSERELFASRRATLQQGTQALQEQLQLARNQLDIVRPLVAKRAVSEVEALKLSQDIANISGKLTELRNTYFQEAYTERAQRKADLAALEPIVRQRQDQLRRTEILSPVRGRVNTVLINTRGGVIPPGEPIMEIIPVEEQLLVEARVRPRDVAFLVPGMQAKVKITAYDYTIYGELRGRVEQISADTIEEDTPQGKESFYQVLVRTDGSELRRGNEVLPIIPGMIAEVDILTGKRSVLNYLMRPLIKAQLR
jgi:membrane fusion protein, adhesin transport system